MEEITKVSNFIHDFIDEDLEKGVYTHVQTRFPPSDRSGNQILQMPSAA